MHLPQLNHNLAATIIKRAELDPNNRAFLFESKSRSYAELSDRVCRLAQSFRDGGVSMGDRVGFVGLNHPAFIEVMLATQVLGAIFVPLNFRLTADELCYIINDAGIHTLVADDQLVPVVESTRSKLPGKRYISSESEHSNWESMEQLMLSNDPITTTVDSGQHDVAIIMYTSGTTGRPKGAMLTHGNLIWNNIQTAYAFPTMSSDVSLVCAPLFHIGGLNVTTLSTMQAGGCLLILRSFDPEQALADIEQHQVSSLFAAPAMLLFMSQHPSFAERDLSSIRQMVVGAAPVPKSLLETYQARNIEVNQGYGLTETSPLVSFLMAQYSDSKLGSAGKPGLFGELKIIDAHDKSLASGEVGEILYRGPNVMKGYWNKPEATAEAINSAGWFHTGDAGYLDEDGFLFISDRVKDMVISGGENVYPAEVEGVLYEHEAIAEVAIIGLADEKWGEAVTAVIALNPGKSVTLEQLREFAGDKLARYKLPLRLHLIDALPRNPAGKVLKFELRDNLKDS